MKKNIVKTLSLILALTLIFSLCACGSTPEAAQSSGTEATAQSPATENPDTSDAGGGAEAPAEAEVEPLTFHMSGTFFETEDAGKSVQYFADKCAELSGGKITATISFGGSEYDSAGVWDALQNNAVQVTLVLGIYSSYVPFMNFAPNPYAENTRDAVEKVNYIFKENETTSKLISDQFASYNMIQLNTMGSGFTSFCTSFDWDTLDELVEKCTAFGTMNAAKYSPLGLTCTAVTAMEAYDSFSRGIIDGVSTALEMGVSNCLYEVADYITIDGQINCSGRLVANLDWLNGLSDAQRDIIQQAALDTEEYFCSYYDNVFEECDAVWFEKTGNHVGSLSEEDAKEWWEMTFRNTANNMMTAQGGTSNEEGMLTILNAWAEYNGFDWTWDGGN